MAINITPDVQETIISTILAILGFFFGHKNGKRVTNNKFKNNNFNKNDLNPT